MRTHRSLSHTLFARSRPPSCFVDVAAAARPLDPSQEPVELAHFSKTRARGVAYDKSQLKRYMRPSVPFDLSEGFETFRDRDRGNPYPADLAPIFESLRRVGGGGGSRVERTA